MAHAAERTVVTVEKFHDGNLLDDPLLAAGTLPGFYVESVAVVERGAWPLPLPDHYAGTPRISRNTRGWPRPRKALRNISNSMCHERRAA